MTPSEKHMVTARQVLAGRRLAFAEESGTDALIDGIAAAIAQAERDGMKRAAEICELRAAQWDANVDGRIPAFLSSYRQRRMADEARTIQRLILSEAGEE